MQNFKIKEQEFWGYSTIWVSVESRDFIRTNE